MTTYSLLLISTHVYPEYVSRSYGEFYKPENNGIFEGIEINITWLGMTHIAEKRGQVINGHMFCSRFIHKLILTRQAVKKSLTGYFSKKKKKVQFRCAINCTIMKVN